MSSFDDWSKFFTSTAARKAERKNKISVVFHRYLRGKNKPPDPNPDKPEKTTFNHDGNNGALRKILNALTSCSGVTFVVNFLLFAQEFH